ncbi:hypothetical protein ZIOFF_026340 [Zingiber officinale]|uniref:Uncharacterized protein n=1 Tax=Zingiber officinale TaxID=94328 RepID=A0A8J5HE61_ZINOF|nr:hypothetical protein ZIOFF_026340 [Zingiber officinale]
MEHNKRQEERKRKGLAADSDTSFKSDDDDDMEEDINLPGKNDLMFLETLDRVKKNDPEILRSDTKIYSSDEEEDKGNDDERAKRRAVKKERPLYLKDVNARHLIEEGPEFEDEPLKYD